MERWLVAALITAALVNPAAFGSERTETGAGHQAADLMGPSKTDPQRPLEQPASLLTGRSGHLRPPDARGLLEKVRQAAGHVPFAGRQVTGVRRGRQVTATISQEYHAGDGRRRVETLIPLAARGRVVVDDGRYRWKYEPWRRIVNRHPSTPSAVLPPIDRLLAQYTAMVHSRPEVVAQRWVWRLDLLPRDARKSSQRKWVDAETGLVLRSETMRADGRLMSASHYTDLQFGPQPAHLFRQPGPAGARVIRAKAVASPLTLAAARARFGVPLTAQLPAGYTFVDAVLLPVKRPSVAHMRYHDGLNTVSLYVAPRGSLPYDVSQGEAVALRQGTGRLRTRRGFYVLSWRGPRVDFALVGDIRPELLVTLANGTALTAGAGPAAPPPGRSVSRWLLTLSMLFLGLSGLLLALRRALRWPPADKRRPAARLESEFRR